MTAKDQTGAKSPANVAEFCKLQVLGESHFLASLCNLESQSLRVFFLFVFVFMKAEILNVLEPKLSRRKQKVRAGEPTNTGFLAESLMSSGVELK